MMTVLLCLDIDGVLNSVDDHLAIVEYEDSNINNNERDLKKALADRLLWRGYLGDYVNKAALERLQRLQKLYGFHVLGISSWFNNTDRDNDTYEWLGLINATTSKSTSGSIHRPLAIKDYILENKGRYSAVVALDDQIAGYNMVSDYIYHICPKKGMTEVDWIMLERILKCNN